MTDRIFSPGLLRTIRDIRTQTVERIGQDEKAAEALKLALIEARAEALAPQLEVDPKTLTEAMSDIDTTTLIQGSLTRLSNQLAERVSGAARDLLETLAGEESEDDDAITLDPTRKIEDLEEMTTTLERADVLTLGEIAGASDETLSRLIADVARPQDLAEVTIGRMVEDGTLKVAQARRLGLAAAIATFPKGTPDHASALMEQAETRLERPVTDLGDLLTLDDAAFIKVAGEDGTALRAGIAAVRPMEALRRLTPPPNVDEIIAHLKNGRAEGISRYAGLGLTELAADTDPESAAPKIAARLQAFDAFLADNKGQDWLSMDLSPDSDDLNRLDWSAAGPDRAAIEDGLRAQTRIVDTAPDPVSAAALLDSELTSNTQISLMTSSALQRQANIKQVVADRIIENARDRLLDVSVAIWGEVDRNDAVTYWPGLDPIPNPALANLPGYDALFGPQGSCNCTHCASILGPAAYFADLMQFVDRRITQDALRAVGLDNTHPLALPQRRPDLWQVPLTCAAAQDEIAVVDVIVEVLSQALMARTNVADLDALHTDVLPNAIQGFALPFDRDAAKLNGLMAALGLDPYAAWDILGDKQDDLGQLSALLGTSRVTARAIATPVTDAQLLRRIWRFGLTIDSNEKATEFEMDTALTVSGLTEEVFRALIESPAVDPSNKARVVSAKSSEDAVDTNRLMVTGLTSKTLDRLTRIIRFAAAAGISADRVAHHLDTPTGDLDAQAWIIAARRMHLAQRLMVTDAQAPALFGDVALDHPALAAFKGIHGLPFLHSAHAPEPQTEFAQTEAVLRKATGLSSEDLARLIFELAPQLSANLEAENVADRHLTLSHDTLILLWRHATLARGLDVRPDILLGLTRIITNAQSLTTEGQIEAVIDVIDKARATGLSVERLAINARPKIIPFLSPRLVVSDTVFAIRAGLTEDESRRAIAEHPDVFAPAGLGLNEIVGDIAALRSTDLSAALADLTKAARLRTTLATQLDVSPARAAALTDFVGINFDDLAALDPADFDLAWEGVVTTLSTLSELMPAETIDDAEIAALSPHRAAFSLSPQDRGLTIVAMLACQIYVTTRARGLAAEDLKLLLENWSSTDGWASDMAETLGFAVAADANAAYVLANAAGPGAGPLETLAQVQRLVNMVEAAGIDANALTTLSGLSAANSYDAILAAISTRDATRAETLSNDVAVSTREAERDALVDALIGGGDGQWRAPRDLYDFFLIDIETAGVVKTSRLISATGALQTYVNRIRLGLERSAEDNFVIPPHAVPESEWDWRRSYRIWEANRKVFLWPENYMVPSLRDDRTAPFEAFENEVLSQQIDEDSLAQGYGDYIAAFSKTADLQIAGAFHDMPGYDSPDTLHLFARTAEDPPQWHQWRVRNIVASRRTPALPLIHEPRRPVELDARGSHLGCVIWRNRLRVFWCEITTQPVQSIKNGEAEFIGYNHKYVLFTNEQGLDGTWSPAQRLRIVKNDKVISHIGDGGVVWDPLTDKIPRYATETVLHEEPVDGYSLNAPISQMVFPYIDTNANLVISLGGMNIFDIDLYKRTATHRKTNSSQNAAADRYGYRGPGQAPALTMQQVGAFGSELLQAYVPNRMIYQRSYYAALQMMVDGASQRANAVVMLSQPLDAQSPGLSDARQRQFLEQNSVADAPKLASYAYGRATPRALVVQSNRQSTRFIFQRGATVSLFQPNHAADGPEWESISLGTRLEDDVAKALARGGLDHLLARKTQLDFNESGSALTVSPAYVAETPKQSGGIDFNGPFGTYFREIFFHIPTLLADHMAANGRHAAAQSVLSRVFDPTAEPPEFDFTAESEIEAERRRVWQFVEFVRNKPETLREALTDPAAQNAYRNDPFNPYVIGRLRTSSFQKATVMRYARNLLDWADALFRRFQRETLHEARLLYEIAAQIMGERPLDAGDCRSALPSPYDFATLQPHLDDSANFLVEVENIVRRRHSGAIHGMQMAHYLGNDFAIVRALTAQPDAPRMVTLSMPTTNWSTLIEDDPVARQRLEGLPALKAVAETSVPANTIEAGDSGISLLNTRPRLQGVQATSAHPGGIDAIRTGTVLAAPGIAAKIEIHDFIQTTLRQIGPVFCVPRNPELGALWDRIADRLFKLRNGLDIDGNRGSPPLLSKEIDPLAMVTAQANGGFGEAAGGLGTALPPYRFAWLAAKAREQAGLVQSIGSKLQSALERADSEELSRIRHAQAGAMLTITREARLRDIDIAKASLEELAQRRQGIEGRRDYYQANLDEGLNEWERANQVMVHTSNYTKLVAAMLNGTGGVLSLIPSLGAPTAFSYGGDELGSSAERVAAFFSDTSSVLDTLARSVSLEAGHARRRSGWELQVSQDEAALRELTHREQAAQTRLDMAKTALETHDRSIADHETVGTFLRDRLTGPALIDALARELRNLHNQAVAGARGLLELAVLAYEFERPDDDPRGLIADLAETGPAALLAGEYLSTAISALERNYIEGHHRALEIDQPFSLRQIAPDALIRLREDGSCIFVVPEWAFDLGYPGHYRRRIRSVRLTIDCVTGPYVNVPATLRLISSKMRTTDDPDGVLVKTPVRHANVISTSSAQQDSGIFEFALSDPRYAPFEGMGAVESIWEVSLPPHFRPFDYATISDVVLHVAYESRRSGTLADAVGAEMGSAQTALANVLKAEAVPMMVSLRESWGGALDQLRESAPGTNVILEIDPRDLPMAFENKAIHLDEARILVETSAPTTGRALELTVNDVPVTSLAAASDLPGHWVSGNIALGQDIAARHVIAVTNYHDLDPATLEDVKLLLKVRLR